MNQLCGSWSWRREHAGVQAATGMGSWRPQGLWSLISFTEQNNGCGERQSKAQP